MSIDVTLKRCKLGQFNPDGSLDYNVHVQESKTFKCKNASRHLLEAEVFGQANIDKTCRSLYQVIRNALGAERVMANWYSDYVLGFGKLTPEEQTDLILAEIGNEWTFVRFNRSGPWLVFFKQDKLDFSNMLSFSNKLNAYALFDNEKWYVPEKDDFYHYDMLKKVS